MSAFFDLSSHSVKPTIFKSTARQVILPEDSLGMRLHQKGTSRVLAEIFFTSEEVRTRHCNDGIPFDKCKVYGFPALPSSDTVIRVKLSQLPFLPEPALQEGIFDLLAPYGIVLEGGIFKDQGWFDGTSYAILSIPKEKDIPSLTHDLSWNDESVVYATWSSMPLHCSYCHKPNHSRLDCPVRSALRCWSCLAVGHLRAHCPARTKDAFVPESPHLPKKSVKKTKKSASSKSTVPKRFPPSSDSEPDKPSITRPPPLKQTRPDTSSSMEIEPSLAEGPSQIPPAPSRQSVTTSGLDQVRTPNQTLLLVHYEGRVNLFEAMIIYSVDLSPYTFCYIRIIFCCLTSFPSHVTSIEHLNCRYLNKLLV